MMTRHDPEPQTDRPAASLWIGTYADGGGEGVYPLHRGAAGWTTPAPAHPAQNCSFGVHAARFDLHYLVDEHGGSVGVFRSHDDDGLASWDCLARIPTGGVAPCHIALDRSECWFAVANYASGSLSVQRLDPQTGLPVGMPIVRQNTGSGPNPDRQQSPHAHWVGFSPDNRWLYATDLGTDQVLAFAFDAEDGTLGQPIVALDAPPGSGPRHLLLNPHRPGLAYLACELTNHLIVLEIEGAVFRPRSTVSTLPVDAAQGSIVAHIAANAAGNRLYVSNRGDDSIAVFALDADGMPTLLQHIASGGSWPRMFLMLEAERRLIVANERSGTIALFRLDPDGRLVATAQSMAVPDVVFLGRLG